MLVVSEGDNILAVENEMITNVKISCEERKFRGKHDNYS